MVGLAELLQIIRCNVLELGKHRARLSPVAIFVVCDLTGNGRELVLVDIGGKLVMIEAFRGGYGRSKNLAGCICKRDETITERINLLAGCLDPVFGQHVLQARKIEFG